MSSRQALVIFLLLVVAAPFVVPEFYITILNYIGLYALVALGLVLLTGVGGLTSFGQASFVGLGAYTTAWMTTVWGVSPWVTLVVGLIVTGFIALALGYLTMRLSGYYLPLGTIAWGISLYFLFGNLDFLGGHTGISAVPQISFAGFEFKAKRSYYFLIWFFLLAAMWLTHNLLSSREGRAIRALKDAPLMAEAMGVDTTRSRIVIFIIAALYACISGWLYAHLQRFVNPTPFGLHIGIEYLFMAVVGGAASVWGALLGSGLITVLKQWLQDWLPKLIGSSGNFEMIVFGLLAIVVLHRAPQGLWPLLRRIAPIRRRTDNISAAEPLPRKEMPALGEVVLDARSIFKRFGGLVANNDMSLTVKAGEVMALIGPNGAGKSTMFNCMSGVSPPSAGELFFRGESIVELDARAIAGRGMSRTFQHVRLLPEMSVLENVALGAHLRGEKGVLASLVHLERDEERKLLNEAARQIDRVGLTAVMHEQAGSLSLGQQRIMEIARALCADPVLLLLDEPAAGLRYREKQGLAELLRKLRGEGMAILLVEHDMEFVMGLADRVVVMEFGKKIAEGLPDEVQRDPAVLEAYLGGVQ